MNFVISLFRLIIRINYKKSEDLINNILNIDIKSFVIIIFYIK